MKIIEGKTLSSEILKSLPPRISAFEKKNGRKPVLAIINYFENSPSSFYMSKKIKACEKLGINCKVYAPEISGGQKFFLALLEKISADPGIDALMVERPLPDGFDNLAFWDAMPAEKDVDSLSSLNMGRLFTCKKPAEFLGGKFFVPCTALAVIKLFEKHEINVSGRDIAVVGRSSVIGKPVSHMLTCLDATVTVCHTRTAGIEAKLKSSEIIILAAGKARWLKEKMVSPGTLIIDVGTNFDENGKMCGDADFESLKEKVSGISPVPGGVGPVTLACLIEAAVAASEKNGVKNVN